jgi:deoxyribonuclease-4
MIRFGPAGLGGVKEAVINLESYVKHGLKACEIAFTYGVYIKESETPIIREKAKTLDIKLSIHAPYWINLNSAEKSKVEQSKKRILDCLKIGNLLGATHVVFHPGFYGKIDKEKTYEKIKKEIIELEEERKKHEWKTKLAPETTGKLNVFGSIDEILRLVKETRCSFCIDFSHLYARSLGKASYEEMYSHFKEFKELHCHFSGIEYGDKGEKNHKLTPELEIKKLLNALPKNKEITIINESPSPVSDAEKMLKINQK